MTNIDHHDSARKNDCRDFLDDDSDLDFEDHFTRASLWLERHASHEESGFYSLADVTVIASEFWQSRLPRAAILAAAYELRFHIISFPDRTLGIALSLRH